MILTEFIRRLVERSAAGEGQALAEYAFILGLVAFAAIGALVLVGGAIAGSFTDFLDAAGFSGS